MPPELQHTVMSLARYLQDHPRACDRAQGISLWWFPPTDAPSEIDVLNALDWMVEHGFMKRALAGDGRVSYARADGEGDLVGRVGLALNGIVRR